MLVLLIILSVGLLGVIIYYAVSPKTSRIHRIAAIIALGLIFIALAVCGIIIIKGPAKDPQAVPVPVFQDTAAVKKGPSIVDIIILLVVLLALGLLILRAYRDQKKQAETEKKAEAAKSTVFQVNDELDLKEEEHKDEIKLGDDNFDIEIK